MEGIQHMTGSQWHATVLYAQAPAASLTEDQADAFKAHLPGYSIVFTDGTRLRLEMDVEAATLRKAADEAIKAAQSAYTAAFDGTGAPVAIRVLSSDEHEQELTRSREQLVSIAEIAEIAGVSRQRAHQLTALPDFPAPVAELKSGKVFPLRSVREFLAAWPRKTGRPPKAATSNS